MGYELHVTQEQYYLCDHQPWMDMKIFVMKDGISFIEMIVDVSNHDKNETIRMGSSWKLIRPTADYHKEVCDLRFVFNDVDDLVLVGLEIQGVSGVKHVINIICHL